MLTKQNFMQKSIEGVVNVLKRELIEDANGEHYEIDVNVHTTEEPRLIIEQADLPQHLINSVTNGMSDGTKVLIALGEDNQPKRGKDGKFCINKYQYSMFHETAVIEMITELMHQVHQADDNIVFSEHLIDFKMSPLTWFKKYGKKFAQKQY